LETFHVDAKATEFHFSNLLQLLRETLKVRERHDSSVHEAKRTNIQRKVQLLDADVMLLLPGYPRYPKSYNSTTQSDSELDTKYT
jgi:hypothetical protein